MRKLKNKQHKEQVHTYAKRYLFTHEQWFASMADFEIAFLSKYKDLYEQQPALFLQKINSPAEVAKQLKVILKVHKHAVTRTKRETIEQFLSEVHTEQLFHEIIQLANIVRLIDYENVPHYTFVQQEGELAELQEQLHTKSIFLINKDMQQVEISLQAVLYFLLLNACLYEHDLTHEIEFEDEIVPYEISYATGLRDKDLSDYCIDVEQSVPQMLFFAVIAYTKGFRLLDRQISAFDERDGEEEQVLAESASQMKEILEPHFEATLNAIYLRLLEKKYAQLERNDKQLKAVKADMQKKLDKQKQKIEQLTYSTKLLKQEIQVEKTTSKVNADESKKLYEQISQLQLENKQSKELLKDQERLTSKKEKEYTMRIQDRQAENERLNDRVSTLQKELVYEKRQKVVQQANTFESWLEEGQQFLRTINVAEEQKLKDFIAIAEHMMEEKTLALSKVSLATNKIGYCKIEGNEIYVQVIGELLRVRKIPEAQYVVEGQFLEVTNEGEFVVAFDSIYYEGPQDDKITHFVMIENRQNKPFAKVNGVMVPIKYRENVFVKERQIVSINAKHELVSYYQFRPFTLEQLIPAIYAKQHEPLYVVQTLKNGLVVRTLQGEERYENIQQNIAAHSFLIISQEKAVTYIEQSGSLYKQSDYYKEKQYASVSEIDENDVYILKANGEYVRLSYFSNSQSLQLGDTILVDEFNRFIQMIDLPEKTFTSRTIEQKLLSSGRKVTRRSAKGSVPKEQFLLIIGNVRLSERYKKYFGQYGYEVEVVDGVGPFEKIKQACSNADIILYSTAFTSHKNSGKMNKEVQKAYILCDSTSPQVMLSYLPIYEDIKKTEFSN